MSDRDIARVVLLPDGRKLSFRSIGPRDGALVLYLHGALGSPQSSCPRLEALTADLGIRYVMVSRPGFGDSDRAPRRTLSSFARDAAALADHLGRERFAVVGVSAGGPYALACAHELPGRVAAAAVVGGLGSMPAGLPDATRLALRALHARPAACARAGDALCAVARRRPDALAAVLRARASAVDRRLLAEADAEERAADRFLAAARNGVGGMIDDVLICTRPWGFAPADIRGLVHVWHGVQDQLVPVDHAIHLAAELPCAQLALHPDEGHFFYRRRLREILSDVVAEFTSAPRSTMP